MCRMLGKNPIKTLLVLLPMGVIAFGILSFVIFFDKSNADVKEDTGVGDIFQKPVEKSELKKTVEMLATRIGPRHAGNAYNKLKVAATWLESSMGPSNMGYKVEKQRYEVSGKEYVNLTVEIPGKTKPEEIVVVGAHYDSAQDCPGANDNGSGVAALLALANSYVGSENARTLRFVAFTNEEPPFFQTSSMGSVMYAQKCKSLGENIVAMLSLETMGYFSDEPGSQQMPPTVRGRFPDMGNFIAFVSRPESEALVKQCADAFRKAGNFPIQEVVLSEEIPGIGFSDHWSFWQEGYPAMMITDTAPYRYPHYHKPTDTPDKIDYDRLFDVVEGVGAVIKDLVK